MKSFMNLYKKFSFCGKILLFISLLLIALFTFNSLKKKEGYQQMDNFLFKQGPEIYDDFYADIYDHLVFNQLKNDYEFGQIMEYTNPTTKSIILDIGCGTGNQVAKLSDANLNVIGIDISPSMISKAKEKFPLLNFKLADAREGNIFNHNFTHILCMHFTIYCFQDKQQFFYNCINWLMPGGYLVVHVVDKEKFEPILNENPLYIVSPDKYISKQLNKTKSKIDSFNYSSTFDFDKQSNLVTFHEKFEFENGKVRKQEHKLYMDTDIVERAKIAGFIVQGKIDLVNCGYDNQFLYIFMKV